MWLRPYSVPGVNKAMFRDEFKILVSLGVLEEANESEWWSPLFAQSRAKTNCVRFLSGFQNLKSKLKHNPYPMPKIREMLLNLEVFQYAMSLDLNMVYYCILLNGQAIKLCTIILPWEFYKRLSMEVSNSPVISMRIWMQCSVELNLSEHTLTTYW